MNDRLIISLQARIDAAMDHGDFSQVCGTQAAVDAETLLRNSMGSDGSLPLTTASVLAWFYWTRSVGHQDEQEEDWRKAHALFSVMYQADPDSVPPPFQSFTSVNDLDDHEIADVDQLELQTVTLLNRARDEDDEVALDEAIDQLRTTGSMRPIDAPLVSALGTALMMRFQRAGSMADLTESIDLYRSAVLTSLDDDPDHSEYLHNLSAALQIRYAQFGDLADLDAGIAAARNAISAAASDDTQRAMYLTGLAVELQTRFELAHDRADLDEAIDALREAVAATPADNRQFAQQCSHLANGLMMRALDATRSSDLDEAIELHDRAMSVAPQRGPEYARLLTSRGRALRFRHKLTGNPRDVDEAVRTIGEAIAMTPRDHPEMARRLTSLGLALMDRFSRSDQPKDLDAAISAFRRAAMSTTGSTKERLRAARYWSDIAASAAGTLPTALDGYTRSIELIQLLSWRGLGRASREKNLADQRGLATDGAACAMKAGKSNRAIELLELGRSVLWSQTLATRSDMTDLRLAAPGLAGRLEDVRTLLDGVDSSGLLAYDGG